MDVRQYRIHSYDQDSLHMQSGHTCGVSSVHILTKCNGRVNNTSCTLHNFTNDMQQKDNQCNYYVNNTSCTLHHFTNDMQQKDNPCNYYVNNTSYILHLFTNDMQQKDNLCTIIHGKIKLLSILTRARANPATIVEIAKRM